MDTNQSKNRKIILIVLGVAILIIVVELVWAAINIGKGGIIKSAYNNLADNASPSPAPEQKMGSVVLSAPKNVLKVGEKVTVSVSIDSNNVPTDGTDLVITYDPKILSIETVGAQQKPLVVNNMYSEYPSNAVEPKEGIISVSGITSNKSGVFVKGIFGSMIFKAVSPGKSTISIKFEPDSTTDSSIIETKTGRDILGKVAGIELEVK